MARRHISDPVMTFVMRDNYDRLWRSTCLVILCLCSANLLCLPMAIDLFASVDGRTRRVDECNAFVAYLDAGMIVASVMGFSFM